MSGRCYCAKCGEDITTRCDVYHCDGNTFCGPECLPIGPYIIQYVPGFVDVANIKAFKWTNVADFLSEHPPEEGWEWRHDMHNGFKGAYVNLIQVSAPNEDGVREHWWVSYYSKDPEVIADVYNSDILIWDDSDTNEYHEWKAAKASFAKCSESRWFKKWATAWLAERGYLG